ncbi:MAG: RNB domain-containing ribonuclease [Opitutaceae bacterium]
MTNPNPGQTRYVLQRIAHRVMRERGLEPDFSPAALVELSAIHGPAVPVAKTRDLRALLWCSIDNDDSLDLDQLSVGEALPDGKVRLLVAVADVAALVKLGSAIDAHARENTTSVYTTGQIFPMLPEKLSTNLTSLNLAADRLAIIVDMTFSADGAMVASGVYEAQVRNQAKLAYNSVAAWLEGTGPMPPPIGPVTGLADNIRLQHRTAQLLRTQRHMRGALSLQTLEARPVYAGDVLQDLRAEESNVAKNLIEELMVAANGVVARFLSARKSPSVRRVVRIPTHWDRIVELAATRNFTLPKAPDNVALEKFLLEARDADPVYFPDLSLSVIKLLGKGEYVVEFPGGTAPGHFGLAVKDYAHSTAPNRRFPDLLGQRLVKAALAGKPVPYSNDELTALAQHCTEQEDAAKKVERQVVKSAAAMLLSSRIGEKFDATITGASNKGTYARLARPPVEGKLVDGFAGWKVGDRLTVQLVYTDIERGYIDFKSVGKS